MSTRKTIGSEKPSAVSSAIAVLSLLVPLTSLAWLILAAAGVPSGVDAVELSNAMQAVLSSTAVMLAVSVVVRRWLQILRGHKRQSSSLSLMSAMFLVVALGCFAFLRSWSHLYMPAAVG